MSKRKKALLVASIISIIILSFIGGQTYSKYVSEVRGDGLAEVATWSFKVNGQQQQAQTINLASTCNEETLLDNKIAPGTSGSFNIIVDGTDSDVGINYKIKFLNETSKPNNLKFKYQNTEFNSISELQESLSGTINANDKDKTKTLNIEWEWKYETGNTGTEIASNDKIDTDNAKAISQYKFNVIVSGTQVEPQ